LNAIGSMHVKCAEMARSTNDPEVRRSFLELEKQWLAHAHAKAPALPPQHNVILFLLLTLAAAAWAILVWHHHGVNMDMRMASPTNAGLREILFLAMWVVMMVAMMFPSTAPMFLAFHKVQAAKREPDDAFVAAWAFVAAYLLTWALAGAAAYVEELVALPCAPHWARPAQPNSAVRSSSSRVFTNSLH